MWRILFLVCTFMLLAACGDSQNDAQLLVLNQSPTADSSSVPVDATLSATFSESIDPGTVDTDSFILTKQGEPVNGTLQVNGNTVTFIPSEPLSLYGTYTATVSSGIYSVFKHRLNQDYQWSFTTRDGAWESLVTFPPGSDTDVSRAAIDDSGRVLLAWSTTEGTFSSFYDNGAWTVPVLLGQGGYVTNVVSANKSFAVFWQVRNGSINQLYCARYVGGAWEPSESFATIDDSSPFVIPTIFSDNSLLVIYWYYDGVNGSRVYSLRLIDGQGWQPSTAVADQNVDWVVAGSHRSGKAVIAWSSAGYPPSTAYVQTYDVDTGWSPAVSVGQSEYLTAHSATVNSRGQFMTSFSTVDDILVASRMNGTGWTLLTSVYQKQQGVFYSPPQVALDNLGNAMLVSAQAISPPYGYLAMRYDNADGWQQAVEVSGGRFPDLFLVISTLEVDESGNYLLVWSGYDTLPGGIEHVYSSRYRNGVGWEMPEYLGRQDADAAFAKVSLNQRGEAVAIWSNFYPPGFGDYTLSLGVGVFH